MTVDIWNTPTMVTKKDGTVEFVKLADLYPADAPKPMTFIPEASVSIGGREIGTAKGTRIIPEGLGETMGYKEVPTPQTPACEHLYHAEWGNSGPIMVCAKCGDWHHD